MSDFDKEAEREKLREKYEQEEEKRKTTEQMSELLLKGATMTNAHCSDCGDPIFRYDGQEFCPTCQKPVDRGTDDGEASADGEADVESGESTAENGEDGSEGIEVTEPSNDASVQFGSEEERASSAAAEDQRPDAGPDRSAESPETAQAPASDTDAYVQQVPSAAPSQPTEADRSSTTADRSSTGTQSTRTGTGASVGEHLDRAQEVLAQTVERHARLAAAADSPRETRDHLETAREAARTLDATGY